MVSGLSIAAKGGLEVYVADSNESLLFRMIRNESELKSTLTAVVYDERSKEPSISNP